MSVVHAAISAVLLFWQSVWHHLLGGADVPWLLGIVFLVLTVRTLLLPLIVRQVRSQRAAQALQPRIQELRSRHTDPAALQRELVALHRAEKVPLAGLLPLLIQAPVFLGLLHVLRHLRPSITDEAAKTLYGWTVAQFDSAANAQLFGAPIAATLTHHLGAPGLTVTVVAVALIMVSAATTYLTARQSILRTGWAEDSVTRTVQRLMVYGLPLSLLASGAIFPIGVLLSWVTQNLFVLGQQAWLLRRYPPPAAQVQ